MINITKEYEFDMAHRLENFNGQCNNIHGHRYKLLVTFARNDEQLCVDVGHNEGMVIDFKIVKELVKKNIVDLMDHSFAYNNTDKVTTEIAMFLKEKINQKLFALPFRLTAEAMSEWIYKKVNKDIEDKDLPIKCTKIVLFETPTCYAKYKE